MERVSAGYGKAAYQALSIFLVVAINKEHTEREIDTMLDTLRLEYNRIGRLEAIYASEDMHAYVREVYGLGVHFPQDAAQYYSCTSRYLDSHQTSTSPRGCLPSREQSWNWSRKEILRTGSDYTLWTKDLKQNFKCYYWPLSHTLFL
ncbi:hypothetical protein I7I53_01326 [Histoplasma capsulatum var. duboisii H88]|uniref:DUF7708 domain-containing protein n=1 Tax=Ajellomyces capsulatus (strain H88) TaxID=544711 RepID=A0A8A1LHR4_AJEC8|nr:hypothetical protein I7I53_01326 [Histoplasma capsulatum var. duboisii H88]